MSKKILSGLLVGTAIIGVTWYISKNKSSKLGKMNQQRQVKNFLKEKFHDNDGILEIVDHMSADDLERAYDVMQELKEDTKKIMVNKNPLKDKLQHFKEEILSLGE